MQVAATSKGYFGAIREPGDVFEVPAGVTGSWFAPVPKAPPEKPKPKVSAKPDPAGDDEPII